MHSSRGLGLAIAAVVALGIGLAACGDDDDGGASGMIIGTTDQPVSYGPAGAYDLPSYDGIYAVYQN